MSEKFVSVKVIPNAKQNKIEILSAADDEILHIKVKVTAQATDGKANVALIKLLSEYFDIPKSYIEIIKGELSRNKLLKIYSC
ncbi:DUF167 domain-containing protein [Candidatus Lariskella endosymbiont of Epinotia ramella]|uniref:DUF167 domain-containing protein n=1 Tax=Candidatus Lariskella endosymbiont of Epinotia ramella TaxID=3066224 RepID=UPI0030D03BE9